MTSAGVGVSTRLRNIRGIRMARLLSILCAFIGISGAALAAAAARTGGLRSGGAAGLQLGRRLCRHQRRLGLGQCQIYGERRRHISGHNRLSER